MATTNTTHSSCAVCSEPYKAASADIDIEIAIRAAGATGPEWGWDDSVRFYVKGERRIIITIELDELDNEAGWDFAMADHAGHSWFFARPCQGRGIVQRLTRFLKTGVRH